MYLNETRCSRDLSVEVLLSLLLLNFKGKPWAQDTLIRENRDKLHDSHCDYVMKLKRVVCSANGIYSRQSKEGDGKDTEARGDGLAYPCLRDFVSIADRGNSHLQTKRKFFKYLLQSWWNFCKHMIDNSLKEMLKMGPY